MSANIATPNSPAGAGSSPSPLFAVGEWLVKGERGISSEFMAAVAICGCVPKAKPRWSDPTPSDAPDLGRCVLLVEAAPVVRESFPALRQASKVWAVYVDHWDELTALWKQGDYHVTTARMKALRAQANTD